MNPISSAQLTRSQLLRLDKLADQLESSFREDPEFLIEDFLTSVEDQQVAEALRAELLRMKQCHPTMVTASTTGDSQPMGRACEVSCFEPGMVIDDFELTQLVGRGATSVVWKARNLRLGRNVALKFPTVFSTTIANRLERESHAVARLSHPNIAMIYENRNHGSGAYLVTEFVEGTSLQQLIDSRQLEIAQAVTLMIQIAEAIAYSHSMQVIHRDLKPQNILIRENGIPVVVDFGLARVLISELSVLTHEGDFVGTPGYMSPEQATGHVDLDHRTDVYSLGALLFQMLTGELPFTGNVQTVIHQILHKTPDSPSKINGEIDTDLDTICLRCMSKNPDDRFSSATELALELRRYQNGDSIHSRRESTLEKVIRWSNKRPLEACLSGLLLLCTLFLVGGTVAYALKMQQMRDQEYELRVQAEDSELEATRLRRQVEQALQESNRQKSIALAKAVENRENVNLLKSIFQDTSPIHWILKSEGTQAGKPPTLKQVFENAAEGLDSNYVGNDRTKANLLETLGDSCRASGLLELARDMLEQARKIRISLPDDDLDPCRVDLIVNQLLFAKLYHDQGDFESALAEYDECCRSIEKVLQDGDCPESLRHAEIEVRFHRGRLFLNLKRNFEAKAEFRRVLDVAKSTQHGNAFLIRASEVGLEFCDAHSLEIPKTEKLADYFQHDSWARKVVDGFGTLTMYRATSQWEKAAKMYPQQLEHLRERLPDDNRWYLLAVGDCAGVHLKAGHYEQAHKYAEFAVKKGEQISPGHPKLLDAKLALGKELVRAGRFEDGYQYLKSVDKYLCEKGCEHEVKTDLLTEITYCALELNRPGEAAKYVKRLSKRSRYWPAVMKAWLCYLESRTSQEIDSDQSAKSMRNAVRLAESLDDPPKNGIWCSRMATIFRAQGDLSQAETMARAGVYYDSQKFFPSHPRVANRQIMLGEILLARGKHREAQDSFSLALESRKSFFSESNPLIAQAESALDKAKQ